MCALLCLFCRFIPCGAARVFALLALCLVGSVTKPLVGPLARRARSPFQFRAATAARGGAGGGGATTPIEMMYLSASSTLICSGTTSARGIIRKKPEVGLGVVGT